MNSTIGIEPISRGLIPLGASIIIHLKSMKKGSISKENIEKFNNKTLFIPLKVKRQETYKNIICIAC